MKTLLLVFLLGGLPQAVYAQTSVVKIAVISSIGNQSSPLANEIKSATKVAFDEINAAETTSNSPKKLRFEAIELSDLGLESNIEAVAKKVCASGAVAVVGPGSSYSAIMSAKIYQRCGLAQVSPTASSDELSQLGLGNNFQMVAKNSAMAIGLAKHIKDSELGGFLVIIDDGSTYAEDFVHNFENFGLSSGLKFKSGFTLRGPNDQNFAQVINKLKPHKGATILFVGGAKQAGSFLLSLKAAKLSFKKIFGSDAACTQDLAFYAENVKNLMDFNCIQNVLPLPQSSEASQWRQKFEAVYGSKDTPTMGIYYRDSIVAIASAIRSAKEVNRRQVLESIKKVNVEGISGKISFKENGDRKEAKLGIFSFESGKWDSSKTFLNP